MVISAGGSGRRSIRTQITGLADRGFTGPVVFDPEGYRKHIACVEAPFHLASDGLVAESLDDAVSTQIALGASVAQTPTGYITAGALGALEAAITQANRLDREDVLFSLPLAATVLDDPDLLVRVMRLMADIKSPVALILGSQFDPFDENTEARIRAVRRLTGGPAQVCSFRTDFNGF
ncbi:MAG: hypothetical protein J0H43_13025, partial [Actinobacteria bacterium]|nr:hypothetical protein [Actinomycetota bacterium]